MSHVPHQHRRASDPEIPIPPGMTVEQLDYFTQQTERAVAKSHKMALDADKVRARQRLVGFAVLFIAFMCNVLYTNHLASEARDKIVRSGDAVSVSGCNRDYEDRVAVRRVLIASKEFTQNAYKRLKLSPEEAELRLEFYDEQLSALPLPDCRVADDVLTDDPDDPIRFPEPLFPAPGREGESIVPPVSSEGGG